MVEDSHALTDGGGCAATDAATYHHHTEHTRQSDDEDANRVELTAAPIAKKVATPTAVQNIEGAGCSTGPRAVIARLACCQTGEGEEEECKDESHNGTHVLLRQS